MKSIDQTAAPANEILGAIVHGCAPRKLNELQEYLAHYYEVDPALFHADGNNLLKGTYAYVMYKAGLHCYYNSAVVAGISYQFMQWYCDNYAFAKADHLYINLEFVKTMKPQIS